MKKLTLPVLVAAMSVAVVAVAGDKNPPATKKIEELAQLTCMLPEPNGTIVCHITALNSTVGGSYECSVEKSCYDGFMSVLKPGQTCLGAIACRPATPTK